MWLLSAFQKLPISEIHNEPRCPHVGYLNERALQVSLANTGNSPPPTTSCEKASHPGLENEGLSRG